MFDFRSVLGLPGAYRLFTGLIAGRVYEVFAREYVRPAPGLRVLDMGCGPGDLLAHLPDVEYVGIDVNPRYVRAARARFGGRGTFRCEDVADTVINDPGSYDVVLAKGVLHHLDDDGARHLLELARQALRPNGRLVTFDGCFVHGQSLAARVLLRLDRGRFVRAAAAYRRLAAEVFAEVDGQIRHDLLRLPYTHLILTCRGAARGALARPA